MKENTRSALIVFGVLSFATLACLSTFRTSQEGASPVDCDSIGLLAYYPLDGHADDACPSAFHGLIAGAVPTEDRDGNANRAYRLDGVDDYVALSQLDELAMPEGTVAMWVRPHDGYQTGDGMQNLFSKDIPSYDNDSIELYFDHATGALRLDYADGNANVFILSNDIEWAEKWHHVAVVWGTVGLRMFVDGFPQDDAIPANLPVGAYSTHLGTHQAETGFFDGDIDDVFIFDRALDEVEIQALMQGNLAVLADEVAAAPTVGVTLTFVPSPTFSTPQATPSAIPSPLPQGLPQSEGSAWEFEERGIIYVRDGNVCLLAGDSPVFLTQAGEYVSRPNFSPSGRYILFGQSGLDDFYDSALWVVNDDGSDARIVANLSDFFEDGTFAGGFEYFGNIRWLSDESGFLFTVNIYNWTQGNLFRMDLNSGQIVTLIESDDAVPRAEAGDGVTIPYQLAVSPDENWIALVDPSSVGFIRTDGTDYRPEVLEYRVLQEGTENIHSAQGRWAEDSSSVTVLLAGWVPHLPDDVIITPGMEQHPTISVWSIPVNGAPIQVSDLNVLPEEYVEGPYVLSLSPDQMHVAYGFSGFPSIRPTIVGIAAMDGSSNDIVYQSDSHQYVGVRWLDDQRVRISAYESPEKSAVFVGKLGGGLEPVEGPEANTRPTPVPAPSQSCSP